MDPTATIREYERANTLRNTEDIAIYADAMVGWLEKGGFMPDCNGRWYGTLDRHKLTCYFRDVRAIAEMA